MTSSSSSSSSSKEAHGRKEEEENGRSKTIKALDPARSKEYVRKLIQERQSSSSSSSGSLVRVEVTDGRTFEGTLGCVDKQLNVVLINATETKRRNEMNEGDASLSTSSSSERLLETRVINMALIAREHRVKMEVLVDDDDAAKEEGEDEGKKENKSLLESALETMRII
jgi:small nuclear ribonucleoprotein (snRNP)-like protein